MNWFTFALALTGTVLGFGNLAFAIHRWRHEREAVDFNVQVRSPATAASSGLPSAEQQFVEAIVTNYGKATARNVSLHSVWLEAVHPTDSPPWAPALVNIPAGESVTFTEEVQFARNRIAIQWVESNRRGLQVRTADAVNLSTDTSDWMTVNLEPPLANWRQWISLRVTHGRSRITH